MISFNISIKTFRRPIYLYIPLALRAVEKFDYNKYEAGRGCEALDKARLIPFQLVAGGLAR